MRPEIKYAICPGSTTSEETNEDYLWIGPEDGINAILILDGTSGTAEDFGGSSNITGGRKYVEKFGEYIQDRLMENSSVDLEKVMKDAISYTWDEFEKEGENAVNEYFEDPSSDTVLPTGETIPGAVGSLARWGDDQIEILHIGDVETCILSEGECYEFEDEVHEEFDETFEEKIKDLKDQVEDPRKSSEVTEMIDKHRNAANLPGTFPNMSFNPLVVEKQGRKVKYDIEKVEKVLLSTDGASPRLRHFFNLEDNREVIEFIDENGAETILDKLREKEEKSELNKLKSSDDAAIALLDFT